MTESPGIRYSLAYLPREKPLRDSAKARFRIAKLCGVCCPRSTQTNIRIAPTTDYKKLAIEAIESELGIPFDTRAIDGRMHPRWDWYFNRITIVEFLDTITVLANMLAKQWDCKKTRNLQNLLEGVATIFREEHLAFRIDENGSIHPFIDAAFSANEVSAISALTGPRYIATAEAISKVDKCLLFEPPDYKEAIRAVFSANENLFKLMSKEIRLDAKSAGDVLGRIIDAAYANGDTQKWASTKLLASFKDWIDAAHFYRHEQGVEEPNQPNEELAVLLIAQGTSFVRWLAQLDSQQQQAIT